MRLGFVVLDALGFIEYHHVPRLCEVEAPVHERPLVGSHHHEHLPVLGLEAFSGRSLGHGVGHRELPWRIDHMDIEVGMPRQDFVHDVVDESLVGEEQDHLGAPFLVEHPARIECLFGFPESHIIRKDALLLEAQRVRAILLVGEHLTVIILSELEFQDGLEAVVEGRSALVSRTGEAVVHLVSLQVDEGFRSFRVPVFAGRFPTESHTQLDAVHSIRVIGKVRPEASGPMSIESYHFVLHVRSKAY